MHEFESCREVLCAMDYCELVSTICYHVATYYEQ